MLCDMERYEFARFWECVRVTDACWLWTGVIGDDGYGRFFLEGKQLRAHRAMWEHKFGAIPAGLFVCHSCDNPPCVNPSHLWLGTPRENTRDRDQKGRRGRGYRIPNPVRGEAHGNSKLTNKLVAEIRTRLAAGTTRQADIAREFGITQTVVSAIGRGRAWRGVGPAIPTSRKPVGGVCGEAVHCARLTADDVRAIRGRYADGGISQAALAREYGVTQGGVQAVLARRTWKHVA